MTLNKLFLSLFLSLIFLPAYAKRVALVIGNDNYISVSKLQKAGNDATAMARELKAAGFTVQLHRDLNYLGMVKAVETFTNGITGGDEVVVFFAGHGVQIKNGSYLLPTDIEANSESQVEKTAYELLALTDKISEAKPAFSLVMVDACRDNPLKSKGRNIGNARGLSAIEPPKGQMVVYSASRGQQALDRLSDKDPNPNGVFTREFITQMQKPGVRIEDIMRNVQDSVETLAKSVRHEQRPAVYNEARGNFYFFGPTTVQVTPAQQKPDTNAIELALWESVKNATTAFEIQAYLNRFPNGFFAEVARVRIDAFVRASAERVAAENALRIAEEARTKEQQRLALEAQNKEKARLAQLTDQKELERILADQRAKEQERVATFNAQKLADEKAKEEAERKLALDRTNQELSKQRAADEAKLLAHEKAFKDEVKRLADEKSVQEFINVNTPGSIFKDCEICPEMVVVPAGRFVMGVSAVEEAKENLPVGIRNRSLPQHEVHVSTFMAGRYEVTVGQYRNFVQATNRISAGGCSVWNGTKFEIVTTKDWRDTGYPQNDSHPVACVSWDDASAYVQWLKQKTGKKYRLLSEAEWEYAARAGTTTARFWGEDGNISCSYANGADLNAKAFVQVTFSKIVANCDDGYAHTAPVGSFKPNAFGLYDMLGNVSEWTQDCWNPDYAGAPLDGRSWTSEACTARVFRGGGWANPPPSLRVGYRYKENSPIRSGVGFRVAMTP